MQSMFYFIDSGPNIQVNFIFDALLENQALQGLSEMCPRTWEAQTMDPMYWEHGVLATLPPAKPLFLPPLPQMCLSNTEARAPF